MVVSTFLMTACMKEENYYTKTDVDSVMGSLQNEINATRDDAATKIDTLKAEYDEKIAALEAEDAKIKEEIKSLTDAYNAKVEELEAADKANADALAAHKAEYEADLALLQKADGDNDAAIKALTDAYNTKVAELEAKDKTIADELAEHKKTYNDKVAELNEKISANETEISNLEADLNAKITQIENETAQEIDKINSLITELQNADLNNQNALAALEEAYNARIAELEGQVDELLSRHVHAYGEWTTFGSAEGVNCENRYYKHTCSDCGIIELRTGSAEDHSFETEYSYNDISHWHACKKCGETKDKAEHSDDGQGVCSECSTTLGPVPYKDWQGREFSVLSVEKIYEPNFEIVGEMTGNKISQAVYERNQAIKEMYNVNIAAYGAAKDDGLDTLTAVIDAGDNDYDLVFLYRDNMATAIISGYMKDLTKVEYIDLENEWYNQSTLESMKISGHLFHMVSDFSLVDKARTNVLFLNRDLAQENALPDIVSMVKNDSWTVEKMYTYASQVANDTNGDGIMDLDDQWGLAMGGKENVLSFWSALGNKVVTVGANNRYSVNLTNRRSLWSIDEIEKLVAPNIAFEGNQFGTYNDCMDTFVAERMLFMSEILSAIENVGQRADFRYTVIPYPMLDEEQSTYYATNDNTYCATFGIPVCAGDFSFSGFMIETLSWQSSKTTFPAYYEVACKVQNSYDAECAEMLDVIFDGVVFDFGLLYSQNVKYVRGLIEKAVYDGTDITEEYGKRTEAMNGNIEMILLTIDENTQGS